MKKTSQKVISSLVILGTATIFNLSYANYVESSNQIKVIPSESNIPRELLTAQNNKQKKYALIIGNSNYTKVGTLKNPVNDADDMGKALQDLGFEVTVIKNGSIRDMKESLNDFKLKLRQGGIGLFFYAGHGVQVDGENYLIPVDAALNSKNDVLYETLPVGMVLNAMEDAGNDANFIILDACRNNPFGRNWSRSPARGLAEQRGIQGSMIAYATTAGDVADDGRGRNGTYTSHILQHIKTPNISVEEMFKRVAQGVIRETNKGQVPWVASSFYGDFSFNSTTDDTPVAIDKPTNSTPPPTNNNTVNNDPVAINKPIPTPPPTNNNTVNNNPVAINKPTPTPPPINNNTNKKPTNSPSTQGGLGELAYVQKLSLSHTIPDIYRPVISPDGRTLFSIDNTALKVWDLNTGKLLRTLSVHIKNTYDDVAISPDGRTLVSIDDTGLKVWDLNTGKLLRTPSGHYYSVDSLAISPDGRTLLSIDPHTVKVWDLNTRKLLRNLSIKNISYHGSVSINLDGRTLIINSENNINVWDLSSGKLLRTLSGHVNRVNSVAISPNGRTLVSGSYDHSIKVWDLNSGKLLRTLSGHEASVNSVAISSNGAILVSGSNDKTIKVWDLNSGKLLRTLSDPENSVNLVAISPDGRTLVSGGGDSTIKVWTVTSP